MALRVAGSGAVAGTRCLGEHSAAARHTSSSPEQYFEDSGSREILSLPPALHALASKAGSAEEVRMQTIYRGIIGCAARRNPTDCACQCASVPCRAVPSAYALTLCTQSWTVKSIRGGVGLS